MDASWHFSLEEKEKNTGMEAVKKKVEKTGHNSWHSTTSLMHTLSYQLSYLPMCHPNAAAPKEKVLESAPAVETGSRSKSRTNERPDIGGDERM